MRVKPIVEIELNNCTYVMHGVDTAVYVAHVAA
jgi:hypothetical protein